VPLSPHQTEMLRTLAGHRNPESYIAGASVLQQDGLRFSKDIDIFQDKEAAVTEAALADANWLTQRGFNVNGFVGNLVFIAFSCGAALTVRG
jgi:hypothetical protein